MQYKNYLARKRTRFEGICGHVNILYGIALTVQGGLIMWKGQQVCGIASQNAYDYFIQNDDGRGKERGELVSPTLFLLERRDKKYQGRWDKVWADARCRQCKCPDHNDHWIWNFEFYSAPVENLKHIFNLTRKGQTGNDGLSMAVFAWHSGFDWGGFQILV